MMILHNKYFMEKKKSSHGGCINNFQVTFLFRLQETARELIFTAFYFALFTVEVAQEQI